MTDQEIRNIIKKSYTQKRRTYMGRDENRLVFQDTEKMCMTNKTLVEAIKRSNKEQSIILENDEIEGLAKEKRYDEPAKILVSKNRSFYAAAGYKDMKVCVHNFASASNPGGGVANGASAQEEALCRCSTLYFNLSDYACMQSFYYPHRNAHDPIHNDDCIYTPDVVVFKSDTSDPRNMKEDDWYKVDVITCAAPNLRSQPSNAHNTGDGNVAAFVDNKRLYEIHYKKMLRILDIVKSKGAEAVILGAFGCGAFRNDPETVARAMKTAIEERKYDFRVIELAVYCPPADERNYDVFKRVFA